MSENRAEVALISKAGIDSDFRESVIAAAKKVLGSLDFAQRYIPMYGLSHLALEYFSKVILAEAGDCGQIPHGESVRKIRLNVIDDTI